MIFIIINYVVYVKCLILFYVHCINGVNLYNLNVVVFVYQQEERFLFPVYTLICVNAAVALDHLQVTFLIVALTSAYNQHLFTITKIRMFWK